MNTNISERDKTIAECLSAQTKTVGELGREFGISRERVCQIYSKVTGLPRGSLVKIKQHHDNMATKFICLGCSTPVSILEGKYLHKYCKDCHKLSQTSNRLMKLTFTCTHCSKKYHPLSISARNALKKDSRKIGNFCSFDCYLSHGVKVGRPLGSKNKPKDGKKMGIEGNIGLQAI